MTKRRPIVIVSACLLGQAVRYDGKSKAINLLPLINQGIALIPVCPECAGGLPTPRAPCEIDPHGDASKVLVGSCCIRNNLGEDCTEQYCRGAELCLGIAKHCHASLALLKDKSPACGTTLVHSGQYDGVLKAGRGIAAELFERHGIKLFNEQQIEQLLKEIKKS